MAIPRTETHAYRIPHVDVTNARTDKHVAADFTPARNETWTAAENKSISAINEKNDDVSFGDPHGLPYFVDSSTDSYSSNTEIHAQLMRKAEHIDCDCEVGCTKNQRENHRQYIRDDAKNEVASIHAFTTADHVYEEVGTFRKEPHSSYDIQDCYEGYSPVVAKTSIDTLFPSWPKICEECAGTYRHSPVYTDRLIYAGKSLLAVEVVLCHRDDVSCFKYRGRREEFDRPTLYSRRHIADRDRDYMLIYSCVKTNAAGIFYSHRWARDVFDLESVLKPSIYVISRACNVPVNTQLYHRFVNNYHGRMSGAGYAPMTFRRGRSAIADCAKCISCNDDLQIPLNDRKRYLKDNDNDEHRQDRSSLLLLEPLLLRPELASPRDDRKSKNPVLRSERTKIVRILIAYISSFFVLISITFYVVYFT